MVLAAIGHGHVRSASAALLERSRATVTDATGIEATAMVMPGAEEEYPFVVVPEAVGSELILQGAVALGALNAGFMTQQLRLSVGSSPEWGSMHTGQITPVIFL